MVGGPGRAALEQGEAGAVVVVKVGALGGAGVGVMGQPDVLGVAGPDISEPARFEALHRQL